ncbi:DUF4129 domain-containing protein [Halobacillus salinus]|uniref:DUF4129 domain-containing protein n=1 Tax=Halobacillus salinus TaxID=192814 RepID=UPI0009A78867|nr:DUF4129 domain-containing protein [Halobacillus salinus]
MSVQSDSKQQIERILEQEEYQAYEKVQEGPVQSLREMVRKWLEDLLQNLFPNASLNSPGVEGLIYLIGLFGIGLLLFLIVRLVQSTKRQSELKNSAPLRHSSHLEWSYLEHLEEAKKFEREGDLKEATRHAFLALLLNLNERNYIAARVFKSNGDYVEELAKSDRTLALSFRELAVFFDQVAYGNQSTTEEQYRSYDQKVRTLIESGSEDAYESQ